MQCTMDSDSESTVAESASTSSASCITIGKPRETVSGRMIVSITT